jgi:endonuclease/exonuclease/phosphatase family metal-dependent hydrolase
MFYHFNTHLDHQVEKAQTEGAKLIRQRMNSLNKEGYPVILTGDMNVAMNSPVCALFEMDHARAEAPETDYKTTCHGYGSKTQVIDHVLYSGLEPWLFQTVQGPWAGYTYISDHNPVMAVFRYH